MAHQHVARPEHLGDRVPTVRQGGSLVLAGAVPGKVDGDGLVAAAFKLRDRAAPAPGSVKGAVDQDKPGGHQLSATASSASVTFRGSVIMRSCPVSMVHSRPDARASSMRTGSRVASVEVQTMWYWGILADPASSRSSSFCSTHFQGWLVSRLAIQD